MAAPDFEAVLGYIEQEVELERDDTGAYVCCSRCGQRAGDTYRAVILPYNRFRVLCALCLTVERPDPDTALRPVEMVSLILNSHGHMVYWRQVGEQVHFVWSEAIVRRS